MEGRKASKEGGSAARRRSAAAAVAAAGAGGPRAHPDNRSTSFQSAILLFDM